MKDPLSLLPILFIFGVAMPFLMGFAISFWLVGKGRRLLWIVPAIVIWYAASWLVAALLPGGLNLAKLLSGWLVAAILVASSYAWRKFATRVKPA